MKPITNLPAGWRHVGDDDGYAPTREYTHKRFGTVVARRWQHNKGGGNLLAFFAYPKGTGDVVRCGTASEAFSVCQERAQ